MARRKPASDMTRLQIRKELRELNALFKETRKAIDRDGGMGGSPGEWMYERMDELTNEQRSRARWRQ